MSAPYLETVTSFSSSGHSDGLGRRELCFDRETGAMLERLHVRPELAAFEAAIRERVELLAAFEDPRFARTCSTDRAADTGELTVVSEFVPGLRLADLLETARDEGIVPGVDAALGYLLDALAGLGALHDTAACPHGLIAPDRTVFTPDGRLVFLDPAYAAVVDRLGLSRRRLWTEFRIAAAPGAGPARLDQAGDLSQVALSAVMLILGRDLEDADYPDNLPSLLMEVVEIAQIRGTAAFASGLQKVLQRLLPLPGRRPYATADEALVDLRQLLRREIGVDVCRYALIDFVQQLNPPQSAVAAFDDELLTDEESAYAEPLEGDEDTADLLPPNQPPDDSPAEDEEIEFELDLDAHVEPAAAHAKVEDDEVYELGSYDLKALGAFAPKRQVPLRRETSAPALDVEPAGAADQSFAEAPDAGDDVGLLAGRRDAETPPEADAANAPDHVGADDSQTALSDAEPLPMVPEADDAVAAPAIVADDLEPAVAESSIAQVPDPVLPIALDEPADLAQPDAAWDATLLSPEDPPVLAEANDAVAEPPLEASAIDPFVADSPISAEPAPPISIAGSDAREPIAEPASAAETDADHHDDPHAHAAEPPASSKGGRRKRQQQKSARARKDKLRSTAAKPETVAAPSPAPAAPVVAPPSIAAPTKSGWLIPPDKTKFEGNAPELQASPFQTTSGHAPTFAAAPPAPPPAPQPVVSYQPSVTPLPAAPAFPALAPHGAPMPRFGSLGTPRPAAPQPPAPAPAAPGPVTFAPVARLTTLKVKAEPPAGYAPTHARRGGRDAMPPLEPVAHLPQGLRQQGLDGASPSRGFPWKLTIAALVIVGVAILLGRAYLPGGALAKPPADAADATLPPADPEPTSAASPSGTGQIVVKTEPTGARILLDGKPAGETPLTLNAIPAGRHVVTLVSSSGSVKRTVRVVSGRSVTLDLPIFSGWIAVFAPFVVDISEDGKSLGTTEHGKLLAAPGQHHLVLTNTDLGFSAEQDVEVTAGDTSAVRINPQGQANLNAIPWAQVWSEGKKIGDTPIANFELPLGSHEFLFKHPQFGERRVTATIRAGRPAAVAVDFTKQN